MNRFILVSSVVFAIIVLGLWFFQSTCEIKNDSDFALKDVAISGNNFSKSISEIQPKDRGTMRFFPPHESEIILKFTAKNQSFTKQILSYYEGGNIHITVKNDFTVESNLELAANGYIERAPLSVSLWLSRLQLTTERMPYARNQVCRN